MKPKYEWLRVRNFSNDECILDEEGNHISIIESLPKGWYKAFGEEMVEELNTILEKYNYQDKYQVLQIKEKYGGLRWYDGGVPQEASIEYDVWLEKYESLSYKTCIECGNPSTHVSKGWILPLCDDCG